jgi:hypothetical protein
LNNPKSNALPCFPRIVLYFPYEVDGKNDGETGRNVETGAADSIEGNETKIL